LSGGLYPISACLVNQKTGEWLNEDGAAHISTSGGAELGCIVAHKVIEMLLRKETIANVHTVTDFFREGMKEMMERHGDIFTGVRQKGVILGLEFNHPEGAVSVSRALYEHGVWAIFSSLDKRAAMETRPCWSDGMCRKFLTVSMRPCRGRANCCAVQTK
jgi:acetylornithine/succinyldiaminopimelate/putrescine aminotransferase